MWLPEEWTVGRDPWHFANIFMIPRMQLLESGRSVDTWCLPVERSKSNIPLVQ